MRNQNPSNSTTTSRIPLKGFCTAHSRNLADFVCEKCRIFYCKRCFRESVSASVRCHSCNAVCTNLKEVNRLRSIRNQISEGFTSGDIADSFVTPGIGFLILGIIFGIFNFAEAKVYWALLILVSGYLVSRIRNLYTNGSDTSSLNNDGWETIFKPVISGILAGIFCFGALFVIAYKFYDSTTYWKMTAEQYPSFSNEQLESKIKSEFKSLTIFDETQLLEETKRNNKSEVSRLQNQQSYFENEMPNCTRTVVVNDYSGGQAYPKNSTVSDQECLSNNQQQINKFGLELANERRFGDRSLSEATDNFGLLKKLAGLFIFFLIIGVFYYPLALGIGATSGNLFDSMNIFKGMRLANILDWDYARVFFIWFVFLLIFTLTIFWEYYVRGYIFVKPEGAKLNNSIYVVKFVTGFIRIYLLAVMANLVGRVLYKNQLNLDKLD